MIRESAIKSAIPFAEKLQANGIRISPKPNTELYELVRLSQPTIDFNVDVDNFSVDAFTQYVVNTTNDNTVASEHSMEMGALVDQLSELVTSHISYAKNVVKPLVSKFAETLMQYKEMAKAPDAASSFNVIQVNLPELLIDSAFLGTLEYYDGKSILAPSKSINLDAKTEDEIKEMLTTGTGRVDNLIKEWVLTIPQGVLTNVWNSFFSQNGGLYYSEVQRSNHFEAAHIALITLLLSNKLFNEVQAGTNESLSGYKNTIAEIREWAGALLSNCLKRIATSIKTKQLVLTMDTMKKTAVVNGVTYNEWLKEGGKPEIIFGLIASGNFISQCDAIDAKAKELETSWYSYCNYYKTIEANLEFSNFKDQLLAQFGNSYADQDDVEKQYLLKYPNIKESSFELYKKEVQAMRTSDMADVYQLALVAIAKCRFGYTSAFQILSDINEVGKLNPNSDVREAALLAAVNYLSSYVATQIAANNG